MSFLMMSIEYLLLSAIFETIKKADEPEKQNTSSNDVLSMWTPLSEEELSYIRRLTN